MHISKALIDDFQVDMAKIMKIYTKPMLVLQCGGDERPGELLPWSDERIQELSTEVALRDKGTYLTVRGDVKVNPQASMTKDLKAEWWIEYLERQRDSQRNSSL